MNKILSILIFSSIFGVSSIKAEMSKIHTGALQTEIKKANRAIFNIMTYDKAGNLLKSGNGFFLNTDGVGVAAYALFEEAYKAEVIDYKGNKLQVHRILGASSNYDLVKFSTKEAKKIEALPVTTSDDYIKGQNLLLITYSGKKKNEPQSVKIEKADKFEKYQYYEVATTNTESNIGYPLVDEEGYAVAILQKNLADKATNACAIDARFVNELNINYVSMLNSDLSNIHIYKGIPEKQAEALTYVYMISNSDSLTAIHALNDFIEQYPDCADGYTARGNFYANHNNYEYCDKDYEVAFELADKKDSKLKIDEVHNGLSKIIYNKVLTHPTPAYKDWTMEKAIEEAQKAYEIKPSAFYLLQQGHCYFAQKEYKKAYDAYHKINTSEQTEGNDWSPKSKAELWIYASEAYQMYMREEKKDCTREDSAHVISLLDHAIQELPRPYTKSDAPYFLNRAQHHETLHNWRKAVLDYNEYEKIIGPKSLNDKFYYLREQAEIKGHMYQQALDDIRTAIAYNPQDPFYPLEEAIVLLKAGMFKESVASCKKSLQMLPENPDCYKIMGIAYGELGNKEKALQNLEKAKQLGDPNTEHYMKKYK